MILAGSNTIVGERISVSPCLARSCTFSQQIVGIAILTLVFTGLIFMICVIGTCWFTNLSNIWCWSICSSTCLNTYVYVTKPVFRTNCNTISRIWISKWTSSTCSNTLSCSIITVCVSITGRWNYTVIQRISVIATWTQFYTSIVVLE